jgi:Domain of unknown function (DUF4331)
MRTLSPRQGTAIGAVAVAALAGLVFPMFGSASSHREAPGIAQDPSADNTDVYAFTSPDDPSSATIVANYSPVEEPSAGPNYYNFSDQVRYGIKIDNTGDGRADVEYHFRFHTRIVNPKTSLYALPPGVTHDPAAPSSSNCTKGAYANLNVPQTYNVIRTDIRGGHRRSSVIAHDVIVPPSNAGGKSTPNYANGLAPPAVCTLSDGTRIFAGQREDPFFADIGAIFDLVNLERRAKTGPVDNLAGFNVHTIAIQVPKKLLTKNGSSPSDVKDPDSVVGVYATADRLAFNYDWRGGKASANASKGKDGKGKSKGKYDSGDGRWTQVSRLGNPLINEVVIPLGQKDRWNGSSPAGDRQFADLYTSPELAANLNALFKVGAPTTGRSDLVGVLLTGLPPGNPFGLVTQVGKGTPAQADLLRLNLAIAATPVAQQKRLGVLDGQLDGFPNGRRLGDDIVDIELQAVAGALVRPAGETPKLGDGVDANDQPFLATFPYVATPIAGVEKINARPVTFPAP